MLATAPAAINAGTLSAACEALHMLPPTVARPLTWMEPISFTPSVTDQKINDQDLVEGLWSWMQKEEGIR